jgi:hypothetical protein
LEKNHRILPLAITNRIIDEINPKESSKEFEEKLQEMPLATCKLPMKLKRFFYL